MSNYGPPPDPFPKPDPDRSQGTPPNYGPPPGYGQPGAYGAPGYGAPGYGPGYGIQQPPYAHWIKRVGATLLDNLIGAVAAIPTFIGAILMGAATTTTTWADGTTTSRLTNTGEHTVGLVIYLVGLLTSLAFFIWNICIRQGRTGQSLGKQVLGIRLLKDPTGQPLGAGLCFGRALLHFLDALPCYIGFLWPLWDGKRQTFADKIVSSVVIDDRAVAQ